MRYFASFFSNSALIKLHEGMIGSSLRSVIVDAVLFPSLSVCLYSQLDQFNLSATPYPTAKPDIDTMLGYFHFPFTNVTGRWFNGYVCSTSLPFICYSKNTLKYHNGSWSGIPRGADGNETEGLLETFVALETGKGNFYKKCFAFNPHRLTTVGEEHSVNVPLIDS